jgi:hypothetical protein
MFLASDLDGTKARLSAPVGQFLDNETTKTGRCQFVSLIMSVPDDGGKDSHRNSVSTRLIVG